MRKFKKLQSLEKFLVIIFIKEKRFKLVKISVINSIFGVKMKQLVQMLLYIYKVCKKYCNTRSPREIKLTNSF